MAEHDIGLGLRERKKRETREALSWAAIRLCVERGWGNVTVEDIAAAANVSPRTFRNYFAGKTDAIAARHLDRMLRAVDELRARPTAEPLWDAITTVFVAQFTPGPETPTVHVEARQWADGVHLMMTEPALRGEIVRVSTAVRDALAAAVAERTGTDVVRDSYPKLVATAVGAACSAAIEHWLEANPPVPVDTVLRDALEQLSTGLRPP